MEKERITEFRSGQELFISSGISKVKVTKDGKVSCKEVPIKSTGISDLIDSFRKGAPTPPLENILVEPSSDIGREMGVSKKQWIKMPNYGDSGYLKRKEEHDSDLGLAIAMQGLDVEIKDKEGVIIEDDDKKLEVLKEMGLTGEQFSQLVNDITSLTKWTEKDEANFLE